MIIILMNSLLHFSIAFHVAISELSNILLSLILLRKPKEFTIPMVTTFTEPSLVEHPCALLRQLTTWRGREGS